MPISKPWSKMTKENIREKAPSKSGIYELKCFGSHVYTGKSKNIRKRLLEHLNEKDPNYFRFKKAGWLGSSGKMEEKHLRKYKKKHGKLPAWNQKKPKKKLI